MENLISKELYKYFLSFFEERDDVFEELNNNPLLNLTEEQNNQSLNFFDLLESDENSIFLRISILQCRTIDSYLRDKNESAIIELDLIDLECFRLCSLEAIKYAQNLSKQTNIDVKTIILYGFISYNNLSNHFVNNKKEQKEFKKKILKPIYKIFKEDYSKTYSNKMFIAYQNSYLKSDDNIW